MLVICMVMNRLQQKFYWIWCTISCPVTTVIIKQWSSWRYVNIDTLIDLVCSGELSCGYSASWRYVNADTLIDLVCSGELSCGYSASWRYVNADTLRDLVCSGELSCGYSASWRYVNTDTLRDLVCSGELSCEYSASWRYVNTNTLRDLECSGELSCWYNASACRLLLRCIQCWHSCPCFSSNSILHCTVLWQKLSMNMVWICALNMCTTIC